MPYIEDGEYLVTRGKASGQVLGTKSFATETCIYIRLGGESSGMKGAVTVSEAECIHWLEQMRKAREELK